ncbi:efflux RND transporter periplasmic adaptor subunit [Oceanicoccus sp. KOV_DT_Chl]|uniref:efflux RND transporter periplasmic adaptor subunit n=1 Tax=Oceanicoccus sp. KOV_DT_Chl TaxID=1904639 RepID=UPI000C7E2EE8|nr:efflux RND transporter periplasmic adaptor subunit [Oceanicoccus sp. KOV_DT_Chl]
MLKTLYLTLSTALLVIACSDQAPLDSEAIDRRISVAPITITPRAVVGQIHSLGVLESAGSVTVNVEFSAPVTKILVDEGQRVKKGQALLSFDTSKLALQREQTLQNLAQAQSQLTNETSNFERLTVLAKQQSVSQQQLDNAAYTFQSAQANVSQLQATLKLIEKDLTSSNVISPINAVVSEKLVEVGVVTSPMEPLLKLEADNSMRFVCFVSESVMPYLQVGLRAKVSTVAGTFESSIYSISAKADSQTGNFEIKVLLENDTGRLRPGMTGDIVLTTLPVEEQIVIPEQALAAYNDHHVVYRIEDGKAIRQRVDVRLGFNDQLFVNKGLKFGQMIATEHVNLLTDGSEVE